MSDNEYIIGVDPANQEGDYTIIRCPKCNKWKIIEPPKEPMPEDLMSNQDIKKCVCDNSLTV